MKRMDGHTEFPQCLMAGEYKFWCRNKILSYDWLHEISNYLPANKQEVKLRFQTQLSPPSTLYIRDATYPDIPVIRQE